MFGPSRKRTKIDILVGAKVGYQSAQRCCSTITTSFTLEAFKVSLAVGFRQWRTFQGRCLQRKARGYRGTTALSTLVSDLCSDKDIDFVFYDSGPNIGALNRVILWIAITSSFLSPATCSRSGRSKHLAAHSHHGLRMVHDC